MIKNRTYKIVNWKANENVTKEMGFGCEDGSNKVIGYQYNNKDE